MKLSPTRQSQAHAQPPAATLLLFSLLMLLLPAAEASANMRGYLDTIDEPLFPDPYTPAAEESRTFVFTAYFENDGGYVKPNNRRDRHYTNGVGITLAHQPGWATDLAELIPFKENFDPQDTWVGFIAAQKMFTPQEITDPNLILDDRPYAGYLFGGIYLQRANARTVDHFQLDIGVVGPASLADRTQRWVHKVIGADEPRGWHHQLSNEPTIQLHVRKTWRLPAFDPLGEMPDDPFQVQLLPQIGASVGTVHRHAEASLTLRAGMYLPDDFGPGRLQNVAAYGPGYRHRDIPWSLYGFARATGRAVQHNIFIDGSDFRSGHGVDSKTLYGEWQIGIAGQIQLGTAHLEVTYSQTFRSREYHGQRSGNGIGALTAAIHMTF